VSGLRLVLSWLTVLPVGPPVVDRRVAGAAIRWAPVVGVLLGAATAGLLAGLITVGAPPLLAGLLTVGALALGTRGMHLDGLADTTDGLGSHAPPERALAVMRDGAAGPFAVVTLVLVLGTQVAALAALGGVGRWVAVGVAVAAGRAGFAWCCRRGVPAARPEGLGALVAGSQPWWVSPLWWTALAAVAVLAVPGRPWQGPLGVLVAAALVMVLSAHTARRFGGVAGDVLGAASELSVTAVLVVLAFGP